MSISARVLSLALAGIVAVPAMSAAQSPVSVGVKAGVNLAKIHEDGSDNVDVANLTGAVGGLFLGKAINNNVGVRLEGLFSQKGAKNKEAGEDAKFKLTYIDVPLLLTVGPNSGGDTHFNVFTGPQFSFNTKAEATFQGQTQDLGNDVKSTDLGWVLGAGLEKGRITADVRYTLGLSDISEDGSKVKNRVIAVMLGIKLK